MYCIKKTLALLLTLVIALSVIPCLPVSAAVAPADGEQYLDSGLYSMPKLTKEQITGLLEANPINMPTEQSEIFAELPSCSAPYAAGAMTETILNRLLGRLNALRAIAGVQSVGLDPSLCENAQYGAVLLASSEYGHYPPQPEDMDDDFYAAGYEATSTSNIYAGMQFLGTVDGFMQDHGTKNLLNMGHRRWQLGPYMRNIGFGYAENADTTYKRFTCEKVFDRNYTCGDYDFIGWPASGYFPNNTTGFIGTTAWSVTLNPSRYTTPVLEDLTVTIVRETDGYEWVLGGTEEYTVDDTGRYLGVSTANSGYVPNCIIFRPDGVTSYYGWYTVRIDGIKNASGTPVDFAYRVNFFEAVPTVAAPNAALNCDGGTLAFNTGAQYPFYYDEIDGRTVAVSGNKGVQPSTSFITLTVNCNEGDVLYFEYNFMPRSIRDSYTFSMDGVELQKLTSASDGWETFTYTVEHGGEKTFKWLYNKAAYNGSGADVLMLDNIRLSSGAAVPGDVDLDGHITYSDISLLYMYMLGLAEFDPKAMENADLNRDGAVNYADITDMYMYMLSGE